MSKTSTVGRRIVGGVVGSLLCGVLLLVAAWAVVVGNTNDNDNEDVALAAFIFLGGLGLVVGATVGAAVGATFAQKVLGQMCYFWEALLGAVVGLLVGVPFVVTVYGAPVALVLIVGGAVIGSGWKAEREPSSSGTQGVYSPGDTPKAQPGQPKCPFCHSTAFRVVEEAGFRRCSECHSVLPSYIQGNG